MKIFLTIDHYIPFYHNLFSTFKAKKRNLTTGLRRPSGKGERVLILGIGGHDGFENYRVIKRKRKQGYFFLSYAYSSYLVFWNTQKFRHLVSV